MRSWPASAGIKVLAILAFAAILPACGDGNNNPPGAGGSLVLSVQDAPLDELVKFEITVTAIVLNPGAVAALPVPEEVELTSLQLSPEVIHLAANIPSGTYDSVEITVASPEIKFRDPVGGDPADDFIVEVKPPLVNSTVSVPVTITVLDGVAQGLLLDFDLEASIQTDVGGNITGVDPVITATVINLSAQGDEFEDITGRVVSVDQVDASNGSFVLESFATCTQFTVEVDSLTVFEDFDGADPPLANELASLMVDHVVEVDGDIFDDGAIFADEVDFENDFPEDELEGLISGVTRDGLNQVTQFRMVLHEIAPCVNSMPASDLITIDVPTDGSVRFRIQDDELVANLALFDDTTDLEAGQKVEVEPVEPFDVATTTYTADDIKLNRQTVRGTVLSVGSTTFELDPNSDLFPDQSITVETSVDTEFEDLANGVADLTPAQAVRVKGLLLRNAAGELILVATKVKPDA